MCGANIDAVVAHANSVKIPGPGDKIFKDECVYSFDTPESESGLYICLKTFLGLGKDHLERHVRKTNSHLFLHHKQIKTERKSSSVEGDGPEKKITRLAIGTEGGFDPNGGKEYDITHEYSIVILPEFTVIPYPCDKLPDVVQKSAKKIIESDSATKIAELSALSGTWDGEIRSVSKHAAHLVQLDNGKKIPPSGWKCEKCDLDTNLWLNLTDGSIMCGRKFYDGTGGNNHAVQHYQETGYPLAVKLGTITKDGKGDVFSYAEDDMVEDPNLVAHLAHFGIKTSQMEKTDKSMVELELDLNQKFGEWAALQEASSQLKPIYGPGYTGLVNLGNSCYFNSLLQVIFTIPDFIQKYVDNAETIFNSNIPNPAEDFNVQMAKLGCGLRSGKYSKPPSSSADSPCTQEGISPNMLLNLIARGHPTFASKIQQDVQEYFLHFISVLQQNCKNSVDPSESFKFQVEERFQCSRSNKVKYLHRDEYCLPLPIPLEAAINKAEVEAFEQRKIEAEAKGAKLDPSDVVRPIVKLSSCLEALIKSETIDQFFSSAVNDKTTAFKTTKLSTFPDVLLLHVKKFKLREDWTPIKLDVSIDMPDTVDLSILRGNGLQPGEELLPETEGPPPVQFNEAILNELVNMGFPLEACKKGCFFTKNQSLEAATQWLMEHLSDSDFSDPFVPPGTSSQKASGFTPNQESVAMLMSMACVEENMAVAALKETNNNLEMAADLIFSNPDSLKEKIKQQNESSQDASSSQQPQFRDGGSQYKLVAFISHMGTSTMAGHYVCHILVDGQWIIFNDNKVAVSENLPKTLGYLYFYRRI
ncbi:unnamed protein product [Bemisia tabaci]|uniref:Ubiquitin carboxyl-terminal hydrolase n=1 Tax=Bemisia tabaci TaxID=7038 RepID=A0A9P0A8U5_BEMTA|nr:PREDICTED: ubiquitin carboxyl-terminal hydrolase 5 [Bemisia tabaci]CAH0386302.1 unnamed protein product [Bemisia tabaci]